MAFNILERTNEYRIQVPISDSLSCDQGDFMMLQSGTALKMAAVSDAKDFIGVSDTKKVASDGQTLIWVVIPGSERVFRGTLNASTTVAVGDKLQWQADKTLKVQSDYAIAEVYAAKTSATDIEYKLLPNAPKWGKGPVKTIKQSIAYSDFTDGGSTSGTLDLTAKLPAGALVLGARFDVSTGFTGDTTATLLLGVSGNTNRFSHIATASVFAAGTVGFGGVGPDATDDPFCTSETTVRVTVTSSTDFTNVSAGAMVIQVYYLETAAFN